MRTQVVDFIARGPGSNVWSWVLVESGPWDEPEVELERLQNRLLDCVDRLLDGALHDRFDEISKKTALLRLDAYDLYGTGLSEFFDRFSNGIFEIPEYKNALAESAFTDETYFELNLRSLDDNNT